MFKERKKLKIAVVTGTYPKVSETFVPNHVAGLLKAGMHVDFFCLHRSPKKTNHKGFKPKELTVKGLQPHKFMLRLKCILEVLVSSKFKFLWPTFKSFNVFKYGKDSINAKQFFKAYYVQYFKLHSYDIVHIHFATNAVKLLPILKNFDKKIVVTFHGFDAHKYNKTYYRELQSLTNVTFTVNTRYTRSKVIDLGFKQSNITIIPVAVDTNIFTPRDKQKISSTFTILFVGRLVPFKAPLGAIKIIENLVKFHKDVQLTIIGDGELYETCANYIKRNGLSEHVRLLGALSQERIKLHMERSDVFLYPGIIDKTGRCENQGLVVQEAQAMGLPVIVSNVGGLPEGVLDGETGFVIEEGDVKGFVEKLLWSIMHPKVRSDLGQNARTFILKKYSRERHIKSLMKIYHND